ncbi:MAG: lipocalin-like domain-containing protein [Acidobacteriota bacterium]
MPSAADRTRRLGLSLGVTLFIVIVGVGCGPPPPPTDTLSVARSLGGPPAEGFARALEVQPIAWPADHGAHRAFQTEWWYFTGHLAAEGGRRFGYQLTFFRQALAPPGSTPPRTSKWATDQAILAHFAVTDVGDQNFHSFERWSREALGLAGVTGAEDLRVWIGDWRAVRDSGAATDRFRLQAAEDTIALDLELEATVDPILHGDQGLSRKGHEAGNASYYFSLPRLTSRGTLRIGTETYSVTGRSWLDREWSTSVLEGQIGWDWFSLQLSDGSDLMAFRLRRPDGTADPASAGTLVTRDDNDRVLDRRTFTAADLRFSEVRYWTARDGAARYPVAWRLEIPSAGLELAIDPLIDPQELTLAFRYWEGAVRARGRRGREDITGFGYLEMTGYTR